MTKSTYADENKTNIDGLVPGELPRTAVRAKAINTQTLKANERQCAADIGKQMIMTKIMMTKEPENLILLLSKQSLRW